MTSNGSEKIAQITPVEINVNGCEPSKGKKFLENIDMDDSKEVSSGYNNRWSALIRACFVEFVGDIIFIFIGSLQGTSGGGVIAAALAHGLTIFVLIAAMGHISGGHFNPAVTTGVLVSGNIPIINAVFYMISQLLGGFIGVLLAKGAGGSMWNTTGGGVTSPPAGSEPLTYTAEGLTCEILFTYLLVTTVLMVAVDTDKNMLAPLAIGISITVDILAGGNISGASMNPARTLGPAIAYSIFGPEGGSHWGIQWIFFVGPAIGACLAGGIYKLILAKDGKRWLLK